MLLNSEQALKLFLAMSCSKGPGAACISGVSTGLLGGVGAGSALPAGDGERGSVGFEG